MFGKISYNSTREEKITNNPYQRTLHKLEILVLTRSLVAVRVHGLETESHLKVLYTGSGWA